MMTRKDLLEFLRNEQLNADHEVAHFNADTALLEYIDDDEIAEAFTAIRRWYA